MSDANPLFVTASRSVPDRDRFRYPPLPADRQTFAWVMLGVLVVAVIACYLDTLHDVSQQWSLPQYQHGGLIPVFAAVLLWLRRESWRDVPLWHRWLGLGIIAVGIAIRTLGTIYVIFTIDNWSIVIPLIGAFVLVGGLPTLRWAGPPIVFLLFMFPLPEFAETRVLHQLKRVATYSSHYALETLGVDCVREGNVIHLEVGEGEARKPLGVEDACSGLRMLTIFIALSVALAMISTNRPWWERSLVVLSSVPIALAVNVIRITVTGLMYNMNFRSELANWVLHDFAGWVMMPMAIGMLYLVTRFLANIVIEEDESATPVFSMGVSGGGSFDAKTPTKAPLPMSDRHG